MRLIYIIFIQALKKSLCFSSKSLHTEKTYTSRQKKYVDILNDNNIQLVISHGPAGTGKSWIACKNALEQLKINKITKIVITRPIIPVDGEELGFLPGAMNEKMNPWVQPLYDLFIEEGGKSELNSMLSSGKIDIVPIGYMRGKTFINTFIIADEMQNSSPSQMKMLLTRLGQNSKMVITGDISQCDLTNKDNGLFHFVNLLKSFYNEPYKMYNDNISIVELTIDDVKRSKFVKNILAIYEKKI